MYKINTDSQEQTIIIKVDNNAIISFGKWIANTDYQQFKKDIQNGVVLNDAEGNPITGSALTTFMETLP